ncbi:hypothetical protein LQV63_22490 [Paenibacillus profundus]|uniref:Uncharacterized protein n=1 Tax=Paenibacillus profundus TaxID=1173085 RepID=A0ABS8YJI3_9BACL|nr:hypothetical protein [Paenibacillus profundus]MCE5172055.1 hypothetical protein [Paenibacillus profundus]
MNNYIAVGKDKFSIDPTAKNVVGADIYAHYEKGINNLNDAVSQGYIIVENG